MGTSVILTQELLEKIAQKSGLEKPLIYAIVVDKTLSPNSSQNTSQVS